MKYLSIILTLLSSSICFAHRDLETGIFLPRDPIGHSDGPSVYCYVNCNPIYAVYEAYEPRPFEWTGGTTENPDRKMANTKDEEAEAELGLLNEGLRYRDLETGTFLTRDPIGYADGPNMYCYVHCNPITSFDPYGLEVYAGIRPGHIGTKMGYRLGITITKKKYFFLGEETISQMYSIGLDPDTTTTADIQWLLLKYGARDPETVAKAMMAAIIAYEAVEQAAELNEQNTDNGTDNSMGGPTATETSEQSSETLQQNADTTGDYVRSDTPELQRSLPKDKHGVMQPDSDAPHTQLGRSTPSHGSEPQAREWMYDDEGRLVPTRDIDFSDHGDPLTHDPIHQHTLTPTNPDNPVGGGFVREGGGGSPLEYPPDNQ